MTQASEVPSPAVSLAYTYGGGRYVNLTSRCPTACVFCIKFSWAYQYRGHNLKLPGEPGVPEILAAVGADLSAYDEVVFCGYGESTYRLDAMAELAPAFRARGARRLRLNTIGLGNLIHGRDITPDLGRFLDVVSISLNSADEAQYEALVRPLPEYRGRAFAAVQEFVRGCVVHVPETIVTAVALPGVDLEAVRRLAESLGARFRARSHLDEYESR